MAATTNTIHISNVRPFQTIGLDFLVEVCYTIVGVTGQAGVSCEGTPATPNALPAPTGGGPLKFNVQHAAAALGHTLTATLTQNNVEVAQTQVIDVVVAGVANPILDGDLTIEGFDGYDKGLPVLKPNAPLKGKFNPAKGDRVMLFVEQPKVVEGRVYPSRLTFADAADVTVPAGPPPRGEWTHGAVRAKSGQRLILVLTKGGDAKVLIQATFK